jgi:rRNA maturation RNase YbeY
MKLELSVHGSDDFTTLQEFRPIILAVLDEKKMQLAYLHVILVNDEYLKSLHRQFLQSDTYTDVMTFPIEEGENREAEIYISLDRARLNSEQYRVELDDEIARLIIHGLLHLKGYDDSNEGSRKMMHEEENRLLEKLWKKKTVTGKNEVSD